LELLVRLALVFVGVLSVATATTTKRGKGNGGVVVALNPPPPPYERATNGRLLPATAEKVVAGQAPELGPGTLSRSQLNAAFASFGRSWAESRTILRCCYQSPITLGCCMGDQQYNSAER